MESQDLTRAKVADPVGTDESHVEGSRRKKEEDEEEEEEDDEKESSTYSRSDQNSTSTSSPTLVGDDDSNDDPSTTSSTTDSDDEIEHDCQRSLEQQLEQFRIQWRKEIRGSEDEDGPSSDRDDAIHKEKEKEQEALFLYRQGVREEKRGNMYSAVMMYRRAMQLVPEIESRVPELRQIKHTYRRRRRRTSSGGSTSEHDGANPEKGGNDGENKGQQPDSNPRETIIEEELQGASTGDRENCFTIPDSDDLGQKDDLKNLMPKLNGEVRVADTQDPPEIKIDDVIPPGVTLVQHIASRRLNSTDAVDKKCCIPASKFPENSGHFSHLPPEIMLYILQWVVSEDCDVRSLERFSAVCRGFYLLARDSDLWKLLCQKMWTVDCAKPKILGYGSWRNMFLRRPHPLFDGIYIAKTSYIRQGDQSMGNTYSHWQLVEYYRYIRLFCDGFMFMLTTCDDPMTTIPKIRSKTTKYPGLMTGYYRTIDCDDGGERLCAVLSRSPTTVAPSRRFGRGNRGANVQAQEPGEKAFHLARSFEVIFSVYRIGNVVHR